MTASDARKVTRRDAPDGRTERSGYTRVPRGDCLGQWGEKWAVPGITFFSSKHSYMNSMELFQTICSQVEKAPLQKESSYITLMKNIMTQCKILIQRGKTSNATIDCLVSTMNCLFVLDCNMIRLKDSYTITTSFVSACFLRMVLLDALSNKKTEDILKRCKCHGHHLAEFEKKSLQPFEAGTFDEVFEKVDNAQNEWHSQLFYDWQQVAYVICFCSDDNTDDKIDIFKLKLIAHYYRDIIAKLQFEHAYLGNVQKCRLRDYDNSYKWLRHSLRRCSDEVFALSRDAVAFTLLSPYVCRSSNPQQTWQQRLNGFAAERALQYQPDILKGSQHLNDDEFNYQYVDAIFLFYSIYQFKQTFQFDFNKFIFLHDLDYAYLVERLDKYKIERCHNAPPLVLYRNKRWYLVTRSAPEPSVTNTLVFTSCENFAQCLKAFLVYIIDKRNGNLIFNKNVTKMYSEVFEFQPPSEAEDASLVPVKVVEF